MTTCAHCSSRSTAGALISSTTSRPSSSRHHSLAGAPNLKALDAEREADPHWFQSHQILGGIAYVDLFAGNLDGVREKIPYFRELGFTYLHLMPLFKCPAGNSDGGYAVSSYCKVNPALGTMDQLRALAGELRREGISLCLDFIFNHTSDEHEWARRAIAGDPKYRAFYPILPRSEADRYNRHLREIFPDQHPGAFSPLSRWTGAAGDDADPEAEWVWTTFNSFQWDLNYANPEAFNAMAEEMLFLANFGVDVLRMDAVAFIWKQLGTNCEKLPEAHLLIQAFNAVARIAAPSLLFKSEAIGHAIGQHLAGDVAGEQRQDQHDGRGNASAHQVSSEQATIGLVVGEEFLDARVHDSALWRGVLSHTGIRWAEASLPDVAMYVHVPSKL